jgi:hypothetical protein
MANMKNWLPDMDLGERLWFDACPKSVLFELARQFAMRLGEEDEPSVDEAFRIMQREWEILHMNEIVPQKPVKLERKLKQALQWQEVMAARAASE